MPGTPYTYTSPDDPAREDDGSDMAATAGLRAARLAFNQQPLFLAAMRAIHRAERAGDLPRREDY